jgi:macrolide transport system ATP-binding/permease protein
MIRRIANIAVKLPLDYLREMLLDMRHASRTLLESPGFALVGIVSMGLGMGLTTFVYTSKWRIVFRDLPAAANAKRLVMPERPASYYYIEQYRDQRSLFSGVAAVQTGIPFNVTFQGDVNAKPARVFGQLVSADYFSVLGVRPQRGRVFNAGVDKPGDAPPVVITDRFWRNRLNSSANAVGQTLHLNGQLATIVGITPKDFNGALAMNPSELFVPITAPAALAPELANDVLHRRDAREFLAIMCLAPGVTFESAESAVDATTRRLDRADPSARTRADSVGRVSLLSAGTMVPLPRNLRAVLAGFFIVLMGLIMTIACMNLANMLLARGASRRRELAIRVALGASRSRLVRQLMSEGILLSLLSGVAGLGVAYGLAALYSRFKRPTTLPVESNFTPDWHAAAFVFVLAVVCGIGFSLVPALRAARADATPALKEGSALRLPGYRRFGLRNVLMVAQVTGSLMLLLITGFLVIGISQISNIEPRVDPRAMYLLSIDPLRNGYTPEQAQELFEKLPERLQTVPAVHRVALAAQPPFGIQDDEDGAIQFTTVGTRGASHVQISAIEETVGAGYFAALGEPVLAGREFSALDQRIQADGSRTLPVVLTESAARGFFGKGNAIGERVRNDKQSYEVVGVVHDVRKGISTSRSVIYVPLTQRNATRPPADGITILVRADAGSDVLSGIRLEIARIDPKLSIFNVRTLSDYLESGRASERFAVDTYGGIGVFGLLLAAIGLAGLTAYAVAQRRKEIGIRMALGAREWQVLLLVLREGAALVAVGTALGFVGAFALARTLSTLTSVVVDALNVGAGDVRLLVGAPLLLAALTMLACYLPARRATRIDPLQSLRAE